jgi:hypothetical protein
LREALAHLGTGGWALVITVGLVLLAVAAAFVGRAAIRRGLREPLVVRLINRASDRVVTVIERQGDRPPSPTPRGTHPASTIRWVCSRCRLTG